MKKLRVLAISFFFFIPCASDAGNIDLQNSTPSDSIELKIDALLQDYTGNNRPGATIGIIHDGRLVFQKGYGQAEVERHVPNSPSRIYKIASVSKQFTAAAIVQLIRQKKIAADDDIRKYIPEFPDYGKPITVYNLLYHTSGVRDYLVLMWLCGRNFEENFTNKEVLKAILRQEALNFEPGQRCVYSNSNYILLAEILERVTGTTLALYTTKNVFAPLGMHHSGFDDEPRVLKNKPVALSYKKNDGRFIAYKNRKQAVGDGGMYTTLEDLAAWDRIFYDTLQHSLGKALLEKGTLADGSSLRYGKGIMLDLYRGQPIQSHPGAFLGYRAEVLRFPEKKITIICLGNTDAINPELLAQDIADLYVFHDPLQQKTEVQPAATDKEPGRENAVVGKYEVAPDVFIDIRYDQGALTGQVTGFPKQILHPDSAGRYKIGDTQDKVVFTPAANPRQLAVVQKQGTTVAHKLAVLGGDVLKEYVGTYYSQEQIATYSFFVEDGALWFIVGTNPKVKVALLKKYERLYFSYQQLETATIDFKRNSFDKVDGFVLNSPRSVNLKFTKQ